ncbi:hypothetical protein QVD17_04377 [Tagetes erecta]|uniref:DUF4005 domain-containing protein n=1 Tax=Tagetes erecta TaxID=13708 RepID=A0AAD8LCM8_TARER|nr:hypothetical protein QVD17_04377 [Tagetes erecta]
MGSWFTAVVKKAFSPHKSSKTATQHHHHHSQNKRSRWLFTKSSSSSPVVTVQQDETNSSVSQLQKHAAAAEPHAAAPPTSSVSVNHHFAAIIIQTSFRAYLARRALRALKGIVMLQAVIRGQNVRKQATITLRCMQALLRVQSRVHEQRSRLSHHESRKSNISENTTLWESKYLQEVKDRKSIDCQYSSTRYLSVHPYHIHYPNFTSGPKSFKAVSFIFGGGTTNIEGEEE